MSAIVVPNNMLRTLLGILNRTKPVSITGFTAMTLPPDRFTRINDVINRG